MVILASTSPRRRELLARLTRDFAIQPPEVEEKTTKNRPSDVCMQLARIKAESVAAKHPHELVLGCDTVVFFRGSLIGKPKDRADAVNILSTLNGKFHYVYSGVCMIKDGREEKAYAVSRVKMKKMSLREVEEYVDSGSPMDKAGAYGVQDGVVERYDGEYENIMGLPLKLIGGMELWKER